MTPVDQPTAPLGLVEKTRIGAAVAAAALLLYTMGWMVARPHDPNLAVTFVRSGRAVAATWPTLAVLTVVAGIIGTVLAGPRLPEAGVFAAAIGLAVLSLRGGSMQVLLAAEQATTEPARQAFMTAMALDCLLWSGILLATWVAVTWAWRWVWLNGNAPALLSGKPATSAAAPSAAKPAGGPGKAPKSASAAGTGAGWSALVVTGVVGVFVVWLTAGRTPVANVHRGQTIAAVAAGLYLGAMAARYFTGVRDVRWYALAVPAVGLTAYLVGYLSSDMQWAEGPPYHYYKYLATTPSHDLARPLPIEFVAVGMAAVLAGYWGGDKVEQVATRE
ncbi:MAG TPA: hypothetical protein PL151_03845 [Phycisphaerae bacterium]|nr:hypothetical protein [Phycisphaerae bacterium]HOJ75473.1 hypothetical protein [Phycisphaerae bacterium]HOM52273.1 hypothetical protein [Phycisphaerae bacterium]HON66275.1 hypothetical protein [Phycisphaerae bacterium]HPP24943.1 hypothetical protein [Phycisphaerae bacterium]